MILWLTMRRSLRSFNGQTILQTLRRSIGPLLSFSAALIIVLVLLTLVLTAINIDVGKAARDFVAGTVSDSDQRARTIMRALPILLAASGLLITYTAGLWNIGVEGQVMMGAVFAAWAAQSVADTSPGWLVLPVELILAVIGGALWAAMAALLKIRGNVNEIFGGVALNFVAQNILIYLVNGPWKHGSYTQTDTFKAPALFPSIGATSPFSILAMGIAIVAFLAIFFVLRGTRWGLQLKAMGKSEKSAFLLGVRTNRNVMLSMMTCGGLAGLAGAYQILSPVSDQKLGAGASGGIGFLGILIVLLVNMQAIWVPLVTLFFAIIPLGALKLSITAGLDASLGNVAQSALVLMVLVSNGMRARLRRRSDQQEG